MKRGKSTIIWRGQDFPNAHHVFLVIFHRGFRRQRTGTRNSVRVLPQQHGPYCDRLRTYRPHWVDRQHPGKNWRRASLIGWVRGKSLTACVKQSLKYSIVQSEETIFTFVLPLIPIFFSFFSGCPGTAGCCCGEGTISNRRTAVCQVPAGLSGVPEFPGPPGEGPTPGTAGGREEQEGEPGG